MLRKELRTVTGGVSRFNVLYGALYLIDTSSSSTDYFKSLNSHGIEVIFCLSSNFLDA